MDKIQKKKLKKATLKAFEIANKAMNEHDCYHSAHEGYAILLEEVNELWAHVIQKPKNRCLSSMQIEALQIAAVAIRFASEVCDEERGRK